MSPTIPFLLLAAAAAGVAAGGRISYYDDEAALQPILTRSQERRVCVELCMSGLGGAACGEECVDLAPRGLPVARRPRQNATANTAHSSAGRVAGSVGPHGSGAANSTTARAAPRKQACSVLCANGLGYPLCGCPPDKGVPDRADFLQVCALFCREYDHRLYGCQTCQLYIQQTEPHAVTKRDADEDEDLGLGDIDWSAWCQSKCSDGDGGVACSCDLLPMLSKA